MPLFNYRETLPNPRGYSLQIARTLDTTFRVELVIASETPHVRFVECNPKDLGFFLQEEVYEIVAQIRDEHERETLAHRIARLVRQFADNYAHVYACEWSADGTLLYIHDGTFHPKASVPRKDYGPRNPRAIINASPSASAVENDIAYYRGSVAGNAPHFAIPIGSLIRVFGDVNVDVDEKFYSVVHGEGPAPREFKNTVLVIDHEYAREVTNFLCRNKKAVVHTVVCETMAMADQWVRVGLLSACRASRVNIVRCAMRDRVYAIGVSRECWSEDDVPFGAGVAYVSADRFMPIERHRFTSEVVLLDPIYPNYSYYAHLFDRDNGTMVAVFIQRDEDAILHAMGPEKYMVGKYQNTNIKNIATMSRGRFYRTPMAFHTTHENLVDLLLRSCIYAADDYQGYVCKFVKNCVDTFFRHSVVKHTTQIEEIANDESTRECEQSLDRLELGNSGGETGTSASSNKN